MFTRTTTRSSFLLRSTPISHPIRTLTSTPSLLSKIGSVHFDQTKKNNHPEEDHTAEHAQNSKYADMDESGEHPVKDMNPEKPTSRSTGIKTEGTDTKAGEGENVGVHKEERERPGENMTWGGEK